MNIDSIAYEVTLNPKGLEMTVTMKITGQVAPNAVDNVMLEIPKWVPGDYDFEPYGRDIFSVSATDSNNNSLPVNRNGFTGYAITVKGDGKDNTVTVTYRASCYEPDLGDAMGLVDSNYAILMGTRYLFCPHYTGECSVDYGQLPEGWQMHHPSGAKRIELTNKWIYPSFEVLLDTPVCFGGFDLIEYDVKGTPFYFVFVDKGIGFDATVTTFVKQVCLAAEKIYDVFGLFPFADYTFVLSLNPQAEWGLEHLTSNLSGLGPEVFVDDTMFSTGIRVCAHELFHAWNVRRLRPAPLGQLCHHLSSGCFTEGLWVAEGFTRYYEFLISARAKAYTPDQFFSAVVGYYQHLTQQPAYNRVSVADSSLASFMNHSKYPGRVNNSIDYYDKGMLIAFGLDARLRSTTDNLMYSSLDEAFKNFYLKYFGDGSTVPSDYVGYSTQDVIDYFETVQPGLGSILDEQVRKAGELDTITQFENIGFEVSVTKPNCLGIFFMDDGEPTIYGIADNSAAGEVGLAPNDVIQTVNGFAFSSKGLQWAASQTAEVTLEVLRGHRKLTFNLMPKPFEKLNQLTWKGSKDQATIINSWLHLTIEDKHYFNPAYGDMFNLDFYDNFHGNEKMY